MPEYDMDNCKPYTVLNRTDEFARSRVGITCPFCATDFTAFVWSMAGCGKKCPTCGAIHFSMGKAAQQVEKGV